MKSYKQFLLEYNEINQEHDHGNLEGYVVDTNKDQLDNYLSSNGVSKKVIDELKSRVKRIAIIKNMEVDDDKRGQKIGTELLDNAIDDAYEKNAEAIILIADKSEDNKFDLEKWYQKYGFEKIVTTSNNDSLMLLHEE